MESNAATPTLKLTGEPLAKTVRTAVAEAAADLKAEQGVMPRMAVVIASDDPASLSYARAKQKTGAQLGIDVVIHDLGRDVTPTALHQVCQDLSYDSSVHGILLELPLAKHLNADDALRHIHAWKDIDGMTPENMGLIASGREVEALTSATAQACIRLAESQGPLSGKNVAVIGRGRTVGRPLAAMLVNRHATVTVCHTRTRDLRAAIAGCEVVIVAIGRPRQITGAHLHPGQIVIDAGINFLDGKLTGDVDAASVDGLVAALSPVPGGVGPLTSALIFQNLIRAARRRHPDPLT